LLPRRERARLSRLQLHDAGHGYDLFGMDRDWTVLASALLEPLYRYYFRVDSTGAENIPKHGPAILVANHAGTLPIDAAMLCMDVLRHTDPPRMPRSVVDRFVQGLPFAGVLLSRCGAVSGTPGNARRLLELGELCLVFPEGLPAIGKPFSERYHLHAFRPGFAELAIRLRVPVVPVGIVGSEEQWPQVGRIPFLHPFGLPYLPIVATPVPLPVHYRLHYGQPLDLAAQLPPGEPTAEAFAAASRLTRAEVERLVAQGLAERSSPFR
jgi:1-acyl-sn-glycerol-3-phosphate acyltransferase